MIGAVTMLWRVRRTPLLAAWAAPALLAISACLMLLWQTRAGPAAQLLAVPGAAALGWMLLPWLAHDRRTVVRLVGGVAGFLIVSGAVVPLVINALPPARVSKGRKAVANANRKCPTLPALAPIAKLPAATILTFVDLGPRLLAVTHHNALAGPYHRNGAAILSPDVALDVMRRHGATLVLICPGMSESTIYASEAKDGLYARLAAGRGPDWLVPVPLPKNSPFKLWRRMK